MELQRFWSLCGSGLIVLLAGCDSGPRESGGTRASLPVGTVKQLTVANADDETFTIDYHVAELNEPVTLVLEHSEDLGSTFVTSEAAEGKDELAIGETEGRLTWNAAEDIGTEPQGDLVVRITPYGKRSHDAGTAAVSDPFPYGNNTPPELTACQVASPTGSPVALRITARDQQGDAVVLSGFYSTDGGATFQPAEFSGTGEQPVLLASEGTTVDLRWDARAILGDGLFPDTVVLIVLQDASLTGEGASAPFELNSYRPAVAGITIEDIPASMNGSEPFVNLNEEEATFNLLGPPYGFSLRVRYEPHAMGTDLDTTSLVLTATSGFGEFAGGDDLGPLVLCGEEEGVLQVTESLAIEAGGVTVSATIADVLGNRSEPTSYFFAVETPGKALHPFARADTWAVVLTRDFWTIAGECVGDRVTVTMTFAANGRSDFIDDLILLGLYNEAEAALSEGAAALVKERLLANLRQFYQIEEDGVHGADSCGVTFTLEESEGMSFIAVGGADPAGGYTLGRAYFDYGNVSREHNVGASLGIFSTNLIRFYINTSFSFKQAFDPFIPGRGAPIGTLDEDHVILSQGFVPGAQENQEAENIRYDDLYTAADALGRALAAILAHEVGHSVGLVANGPPPHGLFGGEANASFAEYWTDPYHLDTPGNNLMEAAMSYTTTQYRGSRALRFNELNTAYLLERVLLAR